jgi:hypothetical protein
MDSKVSNLICQTESSPIASHLLLSFQTWLQCHPASCWTPSDSPRPTAALYLAALPPPPTKHHYGSAGHLSYLPHICSDIMLLVKRVHGIWDGRRGHGGLGWKWAGTGAGWPDAGQGGSFWTGKTQIDPWAAQIVKFPYRISNNLCLVLRWSSECLQGSSSFKTSYWPLQPLQMRYLIHQIHFLCLNIRDAPFKLHNACCFPSKA